MAYLVWAKHCDRPYGEQNKSGPSMHRVEESERHSKKLWQYNMERGPRSEQSIGPLNMDLVVQVWKQWLSSLGLKDELDVDVSRLMSGQGGEEKEKYRKMKLNIENLINTHMSRRETGGCFQSIKFCKSQKTRQQEVRERRQVVLLKFVLYSEGKGSCANAFSRAD